MVGNLLTKNKIDELSSRISSLEKEVLKLKKYFRFIKEESDESIWREIEPPYRKIQEKIFKERYPKLYAKVKREK